MNVPLPPRGETQRWNIRETNKRSERALTCKYHIHAVPHAELGERDEVESKTFPNSQTDRVDDCKSLCGQQRRRVDRYTVSVPRWFFFTSVNWPKNEGQMFVLIGCRKLLLNHDSYSWSRSQVWGQLSFRCVTNLVIFYCRLDWLRMNFMSLIDRKIDQLITRQWNCINE